MLSLKQFIYVGIFLIIVLGGIIYTKFSNYIDKTIEHQRDDKIQLIISNINLVLKENQDLLRHKLEQRLEKDKILIAFKDKNRDKLYELTNPILNKLTDFHDIKSMHFILPNNDSFLRTHNPQILDNNVGKYKPLVNKVHKNMRDVSGFEAGKQGYYYRMIYPLFYKYQYLGVVEIGMNTHLILEDIKEHINSNLAIFVHKDALKSDYIKKIKNFHNKFALVDSTDEDKIEQIIANKNFNINNTKMIYKIDKNFYKIDTIKLNDLNGDSKLVIINDITQSQLNAIKTKNNFLVFFVIILFIFIILLYFTYLVLNKTISKQYDEIIIEKDNALVSSKAKSEFLANMSHEIRTPLNAILGFIELLQENETNKEKLGYLSTVIKSSKSLLDIINDILDYSKIENGKLDLEYIDFNPTDEFNITKKLFYVKCKEKNISLYSNFITLPNSLNGDILRLKQVINNLLSNAIKFTPNNKNIFLNIEYKDEYLNIIVKDEGIGISKEYQTSIFKSFSQEDNSTTRKYGGTGLGLTISYNLVKLMGSELKLKSESKIGSTFYFAIPIKEGRSIQKEENTDNNITINGKVLLVEDDKTNQLFMKIVLKKMGLSFNIASDGVEAVAMYKNNKYDILLMDENMPNMNGIEATKQILEYEKINSLKHTPIIALTANAIKGDRERFLNAGMDEYLTKPVDKKKLGSILDIFLKDKKENI